MGNCLVTKLKGVVDNDNLVQLGHNRFIVTGSGSFLLKGYTEGPLAVKSVNNNSLNYVIAQNEDYPIVVPSPVPSGTIIDVYKYALQCITAGDGIVLNVDEIVEGQTKMLAYYMPGATGVSGTIENMVKAASGVESLTTFNIRNSQITGDIAALTGKCAAVSGDFNFQSCRGVYGDLAALLEYGSMGHEININGTGITTTQATLDAFAAKGVTIPHEERQVIG